MKEIKKKIAGYLKFQRNVKMGKEEGMVPNLRDLVTEIWAWFNG